MTRYIYMHTYVCVCVSANGLASSCLLDGIMVPFIFYAMLKSVSRLICEYKNKLCAPANGPNVGHAELNYTLKVLRGVNLIFYLLFAHMHTV